MLPPLSPEPPKDAPPPPRQCAPPALQSAARTQRCAAALQSRIHPQLEKHPCTQNRRQDRGGGNG